MSPPPAPPPYSYYFVFTEDSILRVPYLPVELMTRIFKYLPQRELRRISQFSRAWYELVHEAGLELHRTVNDVDSDGLQTVRQIVDHVEMWKSPLRLSLELKYLPPLDVDPDDLGKALHRMFLVFARTLPFIARLSISSTCDITERLCAALSSAAPHLHSLSLELVPRDNAGEVAPGAPLQLPPGFLGGNAPCLRTVTLNAPVLDLASIFAGVREVNLSLCGHQQGFKVAHLFPNAEEVAVTAQGTEGFDLPLPPVYLAGLELSRLTINNSAGRCVRLSTRGMTWLQGAELNYDSLFLEIPQDLWPAPAREFTANLSREGGSLRTDFTPPGGDILAVTVDSSDGAFHAAVRVTLDALARTTIDELAALPSTRLTSVVLVDSLLGQLLQTELALPALRTLHIACTRAAERPCITVRGRHVELCALRCPALAEVRLFARNRAPSFVSHARVALLGWLLTQTAELAIAPPRLVLAGVLLYDDGPIDGFSSVQTVDHSATAVYYARHDG